MLDVFKTCHMVWVSSKRVFCVIYGGLIQESLTWITCQLMSSKVWTMSQTMTQLNENIPCHARWPDSSCHCMGYILAMSRWLWTMLILWLDLTRTSSCHKWMTWGIIELSHVPITHAETALCLHFWHDVTLDVAQKVLIYYMVPRASMSKHEG